MKRLIALLSAVIALACFAGCLVALNWIWTVKKPLIDKTNLAFGRIEEVLEVAQKTIDDVEKNLTASRCSFQLSESTGGPSKAQSPGFIETMMVRSAASMMSANVADVQKTLDKVTEASVVANSILDSLQGLEGIERIDMGKVREMQSQIGGVTTASLQLGGLLNSVSKESDAEKSARIVATLDQVIQLAEQYEKQVVLLQQKVGQYKHETLYWMNRAPTLATFTLSWVAISQVVVIVFITRMVRRSPR